ncbi:LUD domain-containing protein [Streptomyces himalayensis]|uniref:LUD domain-containing protein n=1 Tax=Streptomyces himalayensis subsp. himalayensis TaxID=2756131 RepID=A0A7W0DUZ5_9ACTN|nr:LUD domain-containing protein [Streptomyces himalayensis]MBA2951781.1 LUD domain-containing protein [Streptomyces himalayensis subsp. himalayensis]
MNDFQEIADRVEIEALLGEFTDAVMMRDRARLAALFTTDGALRMPNVPVELVGREEIRTGAERLQSRWDFFVQNSHLGTIQLDGDTATGRTYMHELARTLDGLEGVNFAIYHDTYRRTPEGWKFAERVYEVRYVDTTPLGGSAPGANGHIHGAGHAGESGHAPGTGRADASATGAADDFAEPASAERLDRTIEALRANGFTAELHDDAAAARARIKELIPPGARVFTGASETLRLSGIEEDINAGDRYQAIRPRVLKMDRATEFDEIRRLVAAPDAFVASIAAVTETGSLVIASGSGSQLPACAGGAASAIWVVGAQKVVPDLSTALRRVEEHALPLENERAQAVYGQPSAVNRLLVLNAEPQPGRSTVLLLREAIGF